MKNAFNLQTPDKKKLFRENMVTTAKDVASEIGIDTPWERLQKPENAFVKTLPLRLGKNEFGDLSIHM